ncbi:MAG TPA: polysaccharide biosynthesis tyrosine autokinase [Oleiagrimonas sp.]|nr:polysaccharide biosynthesis tyrosine autokinase [Oleiagrimonas sp.]
MPSRSNEVPATAMDDNDEIDLRELLGTLWDKRWLIAIVTGIFFIVSLAYAILATPVYQANAMVQVEQKIPTLPGLQDLSQLAGDSAPEAVTEIALMTSRMVIGKVVDKFNLDIVVTPHRFPLIGGFIARHYSPDQPGDVAGPWLGMDSYDWGGTDLDIYQLDVPQSLLDQQLTLVAGKNHTFKLYDGDGNLLLQGATGGPVKGHGVTIQVKTLNANPGMEFDVVHQRRLETIAQVQSILSASEQGKDSGIIGVSYQDIDPDRATTVLDGVVEQYVLQNVQRASAEAAQSLKFVKDQLPGIHERLEKAEDALAAYQTKVHTANLDLKTKGLLDQIAAIETSLSQLKIQQAEVEQKFTARHPAYQTMVQQIGDLNAKKKALENQISNLPDTQQKLLRLTLDVQVSTQLYTAMLSQAQQLNVARAGTVGNARVVDEAAVNVTQPVKPKRALIVIVGILLGGFLSVAWVFLQQMLNRGIEDPKDIEQLGLPVYASIPLSTYQRDIETRYSGGHRRTDGKLHLLSVDEPADLAVEALRSLRTSLHFAMLEAGNNIIMISGASPDAGKTFVSTNLAAVIAQAGQRVLLLDGDLRKGALHHVMGDGTGGLSGLLSGKVELDDAIHHTSIEGLDFIARGQIPPNPSELLMHSNFTQLLKQVVPRYDLVIIDTPPILAVTDAAIIGNHADTSLLVARFGMNQAREIELAKQRFEQNRVRIKGAIFNAVEKRAAGYYSYGYYEYRTAKA